MFLPGESFFSAALQFDPSLIEFGVAQKVIPASPTTLISLLRAVHYGWRQEKLAEDAHEISELGRELYERIAIWLEHLGRIGKGLTGAVSTYNSSIGSLETRVLVSARRFRELVGPDARELPEVESVDVAVRQLQAEEAPPALEPPALEPPAFSESARDR
jgi:DNA recombination protein RmuC